MSARFEMCYQLSNVLMYIQIAKEFKDYRYSGGIRIWKILAFIILIMIGNSGACIERRLLDPYQVVVEENEGFRFHRISWGLGSPHPPSSLLNESSMFISWGLSSKSKSCVFEIMRSYFFVNTAIV